MIETIGIIGGTGVGETFARRGGSEHVHVDTPFGRPSAPILRSQLHGVNCLFLSRHGEGHTLSPSAVPYRANIYALKSLGATAILASGATGSLQEKFAPGDLVICDQVIDKTFRREGTFFDQGLAVHIEFADPFCESLREVLLSAAATIDVGSHDGGTYVCMEGPAFSTRAESVLHRSWGADLIGMTCMPEAKLAREAEMCYALVALPTDYDCWRTQEGRKSKSALLEEIVSNMRRASAAAGSLIEAAIRRMGESSRGGCGCRQALDLAIWSDKGKVSMEVVRKLEPLIGRHFVEKGEDRGR